MSIAINRLVKRLRRRFPAANIQYGLVWEVTKHQWPHAHVLLRAPYVPHRLLSRLWRALTGATIVDIRAVKSTAHVTHYLAKYLSKDLQAPAGMKRYRTSRRYSDVPKPVKLRDLLNLGPFGLTSLDIDTIARTWHTYGWQLETAYGYVLIAYGPAGPPRDGPDSPPELDFFPATRTV